MKRKSKEISHLSLIPVKLFLDDVQTIVDIMQEVGEEPRIEIVAEDYELFSLEELKLLNKKVIHTLRIRSYSKHNSRATFNVTKSYVSINCDEDSLLLKGVLKSLEELVRQKRKWTLYILGALSLSLFVVALYFIFSGVLRAEKNILAIGAGLFLAWSLSGLSLFLTQMVQRSDIIIAQRYEQQTAWEKNRDIILVVITAALTLLVTLIAQELSG